MSRFETVVGAALEGMRLDRAVAMIVGVSRSAARGLIDGRGVRLDDAVTPVRSTRLASGQRLTVDGASITTSSLPEPDADVGFAVVFEDDDVVVVDKPAGLVVHPGAGRAGATLVNGLLARYPEIARVGDASRPGIVHRLDRGTSGLLVVARSSGAHARLVAEFQARRPERLYTALAWGHVEAPDGVIDAPIARSKRNRLRMAVSAQGRQARTRYARDRLLHEPHAASLLTCRLESGRTHQVRVHLQAIGHPVAGDHLYSARREADAALGLDRPFLHARRLVFEHPVTSETIRAESPLPDDLKAALSRLT